MFPPLCRHLLNVPATTDRDRVALAALNDTHGEPLTDPLLESAVNAGFNVQVTAAPGTGGALCFGDSGGRLPQLITQEPEA